MDLDQEALEARRTLMERIAVRAGQIIQNVRDEARADVHQKSMDQGPVTKADLEADTFLRSEIEQAWPNDGLISEENWAAGSPIRVQDHCWIIDPLDGTKDFIRGGEDYSVMIGFALQQKPVLGVVYQPSRGHLWSGNAISGQCEYVDASGERHRRALDNKATAPSPVRIAISRSHPENVIHDVLNSGDIQVISKGSVGLKVALIIDGQADVYLSGSTRTKVWDTCGPHALMVAAGGEMSELPGSALRYSTEATHQRGLVAWSPAAKRVFEPSLTAWLAQNAGQSPFK